MRLGPPWARDEPPPIEEVTNDKMRREVSRNRLHLRGTGSLPVDPERARSELTEEQRARRSSRPKSRRFRGLDKIDDRINDLNCRLEDAWQEHRRAEERVRAAAADDAATLAKWIASGERGKRPEAVLYERQRDADATRLTAEALQRTLDEALEERLQYVQRHREKMLAEARADVEQARADLLAHVQELPALRQRLLDARDVLTWVAVFPDPVEGYGFPTSLALGLREPVEATLETKARIDYGRVVAALEADIDALAERHHVQVQRELGTARPPTPLTEAMWSEDEEYKAWAREERDRARRLAEWQDPDRLGAEVRE